MMYDVIIIGGGACGLMAMRELLEKGYSVCLLEANGQCGGRISTLTDVFSAPVEAGAEFIHGDLPLTKDLLTEAGIEFLELTGERAGVKNGNWDRSDPHHQHWDILLKRLKEQKTDLTLDAFLQEHFAGAEYEELREEAKRFARGFDLADPAKLSILSIKNEWINEDQTQYRIPGGYSQLIGYLREKCEQAGGQIRLNTLVKSVRYDQGYAVIQTSRGIEYKAGKVIVTVSVGVLQQKFIDFPLLPASHSNAISQLGFGQVIKIIIEFAIPFWKEKRKGTGFIISDEKIPTWWTQLPMENNILTGWYGGYDLYLDELSTGTVLHSAIKSLSSIFSIEEKILNGLLSNHHIASWTSASETSAGGYSYSTLFSREARAILNEPVNDILYFAGEALSAGESRGTVEAALESGKFVAGKIIQNINSKPS